MMMSNISDGDKVPEARTDGVEYFGHDHPLILFNEDVRKGLEDRDVCCNGCGFKIGISHGFSCMINCGFFIHKFCTLLPKIIEYYPEHPEHPLILYTVPPHKYSHSDCHVCDVFHPSGMQFYYRCESCNFSMDLRCASMFFLLDGGHHKHNLNAHLEPASFLCNFCGEKHPDLGISFRCRTCPFWIHEQCYSLDYEIKHGSHPVHPLLLHFLGGKIKKNDLCGVCNEMIDPAFRLYHCANCNYGIHIKCSTKKWDATIDESTLMEQLIQFPLPSPQIVHSTLIQFIQNLCQWNEAENNSGNDILIHHPAHDHPLTLEFDSSKFIRSIDTEDITKRGVFDVCNACMLPLLDAPYYSCTHSLLCNFVLHKWCANLPSELKHHAHTDKEHTLELKKKLEKCFGFFRCQGCMEIGNGFAYKCNECEEYYLDVRCAALPKEVHYESHDHPLVLKKRRSGGGCILCGNHNFQGECNCKNCNYSSTISQCTLPLLFGCETCNVYIDFKCLILPRKILHWYDQHGFKLTYLKLSFDDIIDDMRAKFEAKNQMDMLAAPSSSRAHRVDWKAECADALRVRPSVLINKFDWTRYVNLNDNHCEFCEEKLEPNQWTYHCSECDQSLGIECVRKIFGLLPSLIKLGGCYDSPHHLHPLTSIAISGILCSRCHEDCMSGIGFQCTECEIVFGLECAYSNYE